MIRERQRSMEEDNRRALEDLRQALSARTSELSTLQQQRDREVNELKTQLSAAQVAAEKMRKKKDRTESEVLSLVLP